MSADDINLRITGVDPGDEIAGARRLQLRTTRGNIPVIVHAADTPGRAVLCISGAIGGYDGPGMLYARLGLELPRLGITVARLNYRMPNEFGECVLDTIAGLTFLKGLQYERAALIGHSFGGAVAINAGTLAPMVTTVIAISASSPARTWLASLRRAHCCCCTARPTRFCRMNARRRFTNARRSPARSSSSPASTIALPRRATNCSKSSATGYSGGSERGVSSPIADAAWRMDRPARHLYCLGSKPSAIRPLIR
jgi:pimeloyl-ACP methyl ester carboxylesterase